MKTNVRKQLQKTIGSTRSQLNEKAVALSVVNSGNASVRDTEQVKIVAEDPAIGVKMQSPLSMQARMHQRQFSYSGIYFNCKMIRYGFRS